MSMSYAMDPVRRRVVRTRCAAGHRSLACASHGGFLRSMIHPWSQYQLVIQSQPTTERTMMTCLGAGFLLTFAGALHMEAARWFCGTVLVLDRG